jgi:hypothetical protein
MEKSNNTAFSLESLINLNNQLVGEFEKQKKILETQKQVLDKRDEEWLKNSNKLEKVQLKAKIKLDVGGTIFSTSLQTLKSQPNRFILSYFILFYLFYSLFLSCCIFISLLLLFILVSLVQCFLEDGKQQSAKMDVFSLIKILSFFDIF